MGIGKYLTAIELVVIALLLAALWWQTMRVSDAKTEYAQLEARVMRDRATQERDLREDSEAQRLTEQQLVAAKEKSDKEKHHAIQVRDQRIAALTLSLRDRPERPAVQAASTTSPAAATGPSGTGAGLYRADGDFLVWFAASAAGIAAERDECRRQYNDAREALKGQTK